MTGTVHLVGAGPGDPGLITLRAAELLQRCDCVIYDYLANPELLELVPDAAERCYVGKIGAQGDQARPPETGEARGRRGNWKQDDINALLLAKARQHASVVRLKGGDPLMFGRGGEEALALREAGIPFSIVPGVTAGIAVPAYAGIPVTHRDCASSVVFVTGREKPGKERSAHDWDALAGIGTLVLYMGVSKLPEISRELIARGRDPQTPAAMIQWGTYPRQRVLNADLASLPERAHGAGMGSPSVVVIGQVAALREHMAWYDTRPLFGKRVVVTRANAGASRLSQLLREAGAEALEWPAMDLRDAPAAALDAAIAALPGHDWVAFSSANAVRAMARRLAVRQLDARAFAPCRIAAVGPATATALADMGLRADLIPEQADASGLAQALLAAGARQVLLPQADNARPEVAEQLRAGGAMVSAIAVYEAVPITERRDLNQAGAIDAVTFASAATVERFCQQVRPADRQTLIRQGCRFVAIGPRTAEALQTAGLPLAATAQEPSLPALVAALAASF
ncbi:MAG: uroporphyrinogen-III C-methyltransferase [Planctomycetota bacterium]